MTVFAKIRGVALWTLHVDSLSFVNSFLLAYPLLIQQRHPLWAAAMRTEPPIFVEDVETASPQVVNKAFEQKNFGHRALIHAHLRCDGQLWGILQPCVFGKPRVWTEADRSIIGAVTEKLTSLAVSYVKTARK